MANAFVDYLDSMNNSGGNTSAALAEAQVLSPFYEKIRIERGLGKYITEKICDGNGHTIVLTGHAGDGKTSLLVQVLSGLGMLEKNTPLKEEWLYENGGIKLYAVKDMSELPEEKQIEYFRKGMDFSMNGISSVLISNTGPLLRCFQTIAGEDAVKNGGVFGEADISDLQNKVLEQLDRNGQDEIKIGSHSVMIINIARIDNVDFAEKAMKKIIADELWQPCTECEMSESCPVYSNRNVVKNNFERISSFVTAYYRFLYESDKRMTVRQMLSQISYAVTGNLKCGKMTGAVTDNEKFRYMFPNLFFGYNGLERSEEAMQIRGIAYANELRLDSAASGDDYKMFVTGDFSSIPSEVRGLIEEQHRIFTRRHMFTDDGKSRYSEKDALYRKALRRFNIVMGQCDKKRLFDELFGKGFSDYVHLLDGGSSVKVKKTIQKAIVDALYTEATGTAAKNADAIPLTVRRSDNVFQQVLIINGKIKKDDIQVVTVPVGNTFEESISRCDIYLRICDKKNYRLSLPLLIYFQQIADGSISTSANPSLTHGISNLKAILLEYVRDNSGTFRVMLNRTGEPQYIDMETDENKLYFN